MDKKKLEVSLLLEALYSLSGFDFRQYNQQSILRRIEHRMRINNIPTISRLTESIIYDENLLNKTGGIVQGMSGSPIIQDNKIIGAVTHVIVDNCKKGYGIFITNMLEEAEN